VATFETNAPFWLLPDVTVALIRALSLRPHGDDVSPVGPFMSSCIPYLFMVTIVTGAVPTDLRAAVRFAILSRETLEPQWHRLGDPLTRIRYRRAFADLDLRRVTGRRSDRAPE